VVVQFCFIGTVFSFVLCENLFRKQSWKFGGFGEGKILKLVGFPARKSV
jgi:hypothetical protein